MTKKSSGCTWCTKKKSLKKLRFVIVERDKPHQGTFCSLECVENYLEKKLPDWFARSVYGSYPTNGTRATQYVRIKRRNMNMPYNDRM